MQHRPSRFRTLVAAALVAVTTLVTLGAATTVAGAQTDDTTVQTTSTLPTDNRQLGDSLTRPNQGMEPQSPGDPGGWLQQSLFFLVCGGIVVIGLLVWRSSRAARAKRTAAGMDPVTRARATGRGVRPSGSDPA
jgi:hypothetical protein